MFHVIGQFFITVSERIAECVAIMSLVCHAISFFQISIPFVWRVLEVEAPCMQVCFSNRVLFYKNLKMIVARLSLEIQNKVTFNKTNTHRTRYLQ
ncbi:hypothetical protein RHMOL_Rhmol06G0214700 [Rhododendron molle]|uniref:Uncharacterized protein n=1 Tax=Rhododendron molle TaxID=49168 RepID=A0ACC0NEL9_RHOML|nr:hypothetical protein RHMOL_Rhmol06G0214700 [Rhododendron molle]